MSKKVKLKKLIKDLEEWTEAKRQDYLCYWETHEPISAVECRAIRDFLEFELIPHIQNKFNKEDE